MHASFQDEGDQLLQQLRRDSTVYKEVQTVLFWVNFARWTAFPPTDNYHAPVIDGEFQVQCLVSHVLPTKMYRENPPRLRLSTYSSLNVDTEE
jgi:hypothetical protein